MKQIKKFSVILLTLALLLLGIGICGAGVQTAVGATHKLKIKLSGDKTVHVTYGKKNVRKKTIQVTKGDKITFSFSKNKKVKSVTYQSMNKKCVTITKKGKATAKKPGTAKIKITINKKKGKSVSTWVKIKVKKKMETKSDDQSPSDGEQPSEQPTNPPAETPTIPAKTITPMDENEFPQISAGEMAIEKSIYTDINGDAAIIPAEFAVSTKNDEQMVSQGLVVIASDGSEFVWIPTSVTSLEVRDFGSYFSGDGSLSDYYDETDLETYQDMRDSVERYGGFFMGRYEASKGDNGLPASKRITDSEPGTIWTQFSPQDTVGVCEKLYSDNDTVQGFFPWGINWDTTLQWLIDSGCKTKAEVASDSTSWGNYSNDSFSEGARGNTTGQWEEAKANNIYDLAGNNWEWTQERYGTSYVMRGGGYNLMGGSCPGNKYPAALRDPLPGNDHHPNVTFRVALYVK